MRHKPIASLLALALLPTPAAFATDAPANLPPLPRSSTTRQIENGLRVEIANNKHRLRTLVGYILLTQRSRMLTLMSRRQGKLPRSPEYRRKDHTSRCINARDGCLNVNAKPQLQFGCYRKGMPNRCTAEAGASG